MITLSDLQRIMPNAGKQAEIFLHPLNDAMDEFEINTPPRQAAFLAQCAHESGELHYVRELASGNAYEGRTDLGNTETGDGVRYKGRGLIQITGRANYQKCGAALGVDLVADPSLLESPELACRSAGWFWKTHGLNELSDTERFDVVTRKINGLYKDLRAGDRDRYGYYESACAVLGLTDATSAA